MSGPPVYSFRKKVTEEVPIMSFQTDKNGTFDPFMAIASGTLRWIIDGEEQITNTPSKELTGSTVDVEVFANTVPEGEDITSIVMFMQNIIGELDFSWFKINGQNICHENPQLNSVKYSTFANALTNTNYKDCDLSTIDFTNCEIDGFIYLWNNSSLSNITFSTGSNTLSQLLAYNCDLASIDLSNVTIDGLGQLRLDNNPLTSIVQPTFTTTLSLYLVTNCALPKPEVNEIFSSINTFMSSNAPLNNLTVNTSGGGMPSPDGDGLAALENLRDNVYPGAGFTFTVIIN